MSGFAVLMRIPILIKIQWLTNLLSLLSSGFGWGLGDPGWAQLRSAGLSSRLQVGYRTAPSAVCGAK